MSASALFGAAMTALARRRPVFHSEADFQHELAWQLHLDHPDARLRLETVPLVGERVHLDLAFTLGDLRVAAELKYLSRSLEVEVDGERFSLRSQAAQDIRRYDAIKDIGRLESMVAAGVADVGVAVVLSNDAGYWEAGRVGTVDESFRLHEGRTLTGPLAWSTRTGAGTMARREDPIVLAGQYGLHWVPFSDVGAQRGGVFRYLLVEVRRELLDTRSLAAASDLAERPEASPPSDVAGPVAKATTCRALVLEAFAALERTGSRSEFSPAEVLAEVRRLGGTHQESTIRTHITSVMCINAPANHAMRYPDLERTAAGRYRRVR